MVSKSTGLHHPIQDRMHPWLDTLGGFFVMSALTAKALSRWPFHWREFVLQSWFLLRVALLPTMMVSIPLMVLFIFSLNSLLDQVGAGSLSGVGAAIGVVTQLGPVVTVLVVAGAGSTAICADLGARTIRGEIDVIEGMGIDPIYRLVVPRVIAAILISTLLNSLVITVGLAGAYLFGVYLQNISGADYLATLTTITGLPEVITSTVKAITFGLIAGLVACYRGLTARGGPTGLGTAVNETVVLCVVALFVVNVVLTGIGVRFGTGR